MADAQAEEAAMSESELERAARIFCKLKGEDPDGQIAHNGFGWCEYPNPHFCGTLVPVGRWRMYIDLIQEQWRKNEAIRLST